MQLDKDNPPDTVVFNGITYRRMGGKRRYYLSQSSSNAGRKRAKGLHVAIWEHHNGKPVPAGHEVHHRDGNTFDCRPENLDCLPKGVHRSLPKNIDREAVRANLAKQRVLANAWHGSPAGLEWHRQHAYRSLRKPDRAPHGARQPILSRACAECGKEFRGWNKRRVYCGPRCSEKVSRRRRRNATGVQPNG